MDKRVFNLSDKISPAPLAARTSCVVSATRNVPAGGVLFIQPAFVRAEIV